MKNEKQQYDKCVSVEILVDFLKYAIDDTQRISGDYDGIVGTLFENDTYEKIAQDYIDEHLKTKP